MCRYLKSSLKKLEFSSQKFESTTTTKTATQEKYKTTLFHSDSKITQRKKRRNFHVTPIRVLQSYFLKYCFNTVSFFFVLLHLYFVVLLHFQNYIFNNILHNIVYMQHEELTA